MRGGTELAGVGAPMGRWLTFWNGQICQETKGK
jgi:hypothetical protein